MAACRAILVLGAALAAATAAHAGPDDAALLDRAHRLLREVPLIDGHNDTPWQYRKRVNLSLDAMDFAADLGALDPPMHTDLRRLRAGGVGAQFWSVYIPVRERGGLPGDARTVIEQIDFVKRLAARYPDDLEIALTADDIVRIHREGRIASLIGMEGGHSIEDSLAVLRATYDLGARYMTLAHSLNTRWCDSATDEAQFGGLTEFGRAVVREMNRIGMLVDLSHVSAETMHDALDVTEAPVIFSHSAAFSICRHARNVPDDVLLRVAENDGVVMITFLGAYVSDDLRLHAEERKARSDALTGEPGADAAAIEAEMAAWDRAHPTPAATVGQVADHVDHVRDLIGISHIGLGGDYDGTTSVPVGLEDVSKYPNLLVELLRRGYRDDEIEAIIGRNVLRVMRDVEQTAARLQKGGGAPEATIEDVPPEAAPGDGGAAPGPARAPRRPGG